MAERASDSGCEISRAVFLYLAYKAYVGTQILRKSAFFCVVRAHSNMQFGEEPNIKNSNRSPGLRAYSPTLAVTSNSA